MLMSDLHIYIWKALVVVNTSLTTDETGSLAFLCQSERLVCLSSSTVGLCPHVENKQGACFSKKTHSSVHLKQDHFVKAAIAVNK